MKEVEIRYGVARVTSSGLLCNGIYYTSSNLIRKQWFKLAESHGSWIIPVLYDEHDPQHVILMNFDQPEIATILPKKKQIDTHLVESYQKAIRNLKLRLTMKVKE